MSEDMSIIYHSAPPMADTGYGTHTRNLLNRMKGDFEVAVHSVGGWEGMGIDWNGIQIYPSGAGEHGEQSIPYWYEETDSDMVFSHHDHWAFADTLRNQQQAGIPMTLYTILDHDLPGKKPPEPVVRANEHAHKTVVMSEWAEDRILRSRIPEEQVEQIPHGVDTTKYAPTPDIPDEELKKDLGVPEDAFLFGMVAANYGPRKNIPLHMQAFKEFREEHDADDAYLYVHTHPKMQGGYDLHKVREMMDLEPERCQFPDSHKVYHGIEDLVIVQILNTFDVHLNATQSESWGLTITEAMSCGTPVIGANNSAQTEQFGVHYDTYVSEDEQFRVTDQGLLVHRGNTIWTQNANARRFIPSVGDIKAAMEYYYFNQDEIEEHGENAREWVVDNYEYDDLYRDQWKPLFEELEEDLTGSEYNHYYMMKRDAECQSGAFMTEAHEIQMDCLGETVLDVGAGPGMLSQHLEEAGFDVTAISYSEEGMEFIENNREADIELYQGDIRDLQFKDDSFDTTVSTHVLEHVDADAQGLSELARVASERVVSIVPRKGGIGSGQDDTEKRRYDEDELDRLKEEFEALVDEDYEMDYERLDVTDDDWNWKITVDV